MNTRPPIHREKTADYNTALVAIIDEDAHHRQSLARGVSLYGYKCVVWENRGDALEALQSTEGAEVKLVIVDIGQDDESGVAFIHRLLEYCTGLPIIALRGLEWDARMKGLTEQGVAILQRPFTAAALADEIEKLLG